MFRRITYLILFLFLLSFGLSFKVDVLEISENGAVLFIKDPGRIKIPFKDYRLFYNGAYNLLEDKNACVFIEESIFCGKKLENLNNLLCINKQDGRKVCFPEEKVKKVLIEEETTFVPKDKGELLLFSPYVKGDTSCFLIPLSGLFAMNCFLEIESKASLDVKELYLYSFYKQDFFYGRYASKALASTPSFEYNAVNNKEEEKDFYFVGKNIKIEGKMQLPFLSALIRNYNIYSITDIFPLYGKEEKQLSFYKKLSFDVDKENGFLKAVPSSKLFVFSEGFLLKNFSFVERTPLGGKLVVDLGKDNKLSGELRLLEVSKEYPVIKEKYEIKLVSKEKRKVKLYFHSDGELKSDLPFVKIKNGALFEFYLDGEKTFYVEVEKSKKENSGFYPRG